MSQDDPRNLVDDFKGMSETAIVNQLDQNGVTLEIAIENLKRDFNMGSIVRTANAFGVRRVHVIGRKQWNKRGAMATDRYLHVEYHASITDFQSRMSEQGRYLVAVDNVPGAGDITRTELPDETVMIFGSESDGISQELLAVSSQVVAIRQLGSTRSLNVAAAAAIAMYEWHRRR